MRFLLLVCVLASTVPLQVGAQSPQQVDQAEILRLGNVVQAVGNGPRSSEIDRFVEALSPPASDADKWFLSVVTTRGCQACEQLKRDWNTDPWLLALANPSDPKQSWAHYNVYAREDRSQAFRFTGLQITAYPTILVQPPRSGKYGDPTTVVFQGVYGGKPQELAEAIGLAIRHYLHQQSSGLAAAQTDNSAPYGVVPPWQLPPRSDQPSVDHAAARLPVDQLFQIIPPKPPSPEFPWSLVLTSLLSGASIPTAAGLLLWGVLGIRGRRQVAGKPPLVNPAQLEQLRELLKALADKQIPLS